VRPYLKKKKKKKPSQKRDDGVAQGVGPEFKPQYHKINKGRIHFLAEFAVNWVFLGTSDKYKGGVSQVMKGYEDP
jgi:hypothetical protein